MTEQEANANLDRWICRSRVVYYDPVYYDAKAIPDFCKLWKEAELGYGPDIVVETSERSEKKPFLKRLKDGLMAGL